MRSLPCRSCRRRPASPWLGAPLAGVLLMVALPWARAAKAEWPVISPAELAETKPMLEPDAPAEVVQLRYDVDDSDFPRRKEFKEYVRFKIFDPAKAADLTRLSDIDSSFSDDYLDVQARLTLPNGRVQEFGKDAIKDRTIARDARTSGFLGWLASSRERVREKFLAIPGIEAGAVLEYRVTRSTDVMQLATVWPIQRENVPVRRAEFHCERCQESSGWLSRTFVFNRLNGRIGDDDAKGRSFTFTATNVPSVAKEPFMGPISDYAMCVVVCYEPLENVLIGRSGTPIPGYVDAKKLGPWAIYSTMDNWFERDRGYATKRVKKLAADITTGLTDEKAKAVAIHDYVRAIYQEWRRQPAPKDTRPPESLDDVLDIKGEPRVQRPPAEFVWLAIALYKSAGLEAHLIMVPDRTLCRFRPDYVAPAFLGHQAVAVQLGGQWHYSEPQWSVPLPFGMLPWEQEGQPGLLALDHQQQFLTIPLTTSEQSVITNTGKFSLDLGGTLTGELKRSFAGQTAVAPRGALSETDPARRRRAARGYLGLDLKTVEISGIKVENVGDPDKPLIVSARVRWPGYAERTKERLVFRPTVFQADDKPPFAAAERRYPVNFHYRWRSIDKLTITVPEGFSPEAPTVPPALDSKVLYHRIDLAYDRAGHTLHMKREFRSEVIDVPVKFYPVIKQWFDAASVEDHRDVVFAGKNIAMPEITAPEPKAGGEAKGDTGAETTDSAENENDPGNR